MATAAAACAASSQRPVDHRAEAVRAAPDCAEGFRTERRAGMMLNTAPATTAAMSVTKTVPFDWLKS